MPASGPASGPAPGRAFAAEAVVRALLREAPLIGTADECEAELRRLRRVRDSVPAQR